MGQLREYGKEISEHKEKILLVYLFNKYKNTKWILPDMKPVEIIKIRMEELG